MTLFDLYRIPFETAWKFEKNKKHVLFKISSIMQSFLQNRVAGSRVGGLGGLGVWEGGGSGGIGVGGSRPNPPSKSSKIAKKLEKFRYFLGIF